MTNNAIIIDNGNDGAVTIDPNAPDARSLMLSSAAAIAATVIDTEGKLSDSAKAWGHNLFRLVYVEGKNMDSMIGDSKVAAGWSVLTTNDVGKKAKARLEVYFSNARKVAEAWGGMDDAAKADVLAGLSSIHYLAGQLRKAEKDAKAAADKAAKLAKAQEEAETAKAQAEASGNEPLQAEPASESIDVVDMLETLTLAFGEMDRDQMAAITDAFNAMTAAYDARVVALLPVAQAA